MINCTCRNMFVVGYGYVHVIPVWLGLRRSWSRIASKIPSYTYNSNLQIFINDIGICMLLDMSLYMIVICVWLRLRRSWSRRCVSCIVMRAASCTWTPWTPASCPTCTCSYAASPLRCIPYCRHTTETCHSWGQLPLYVICDICLQGFIWKKNYESLLIKWKMHLQYNIIGRLLFFFLLIIKFISIRLFTIFHVCYCKFGAQNFLYWN